MFRSNLFLTFLIVFSFSTSVWSQERISTSALEFPKNSIEFVVTFPEAPKVETVFANGHVSKSAKLLGASVQMKVEILEFEEAIMEKFARFDEVQLSSAAWNHGRDNGLESLTVATGSSGFGRYAKMQGYKTLSGERMIFEAFFYYGKRQVFVLYVVSPSRLYPTKSITKFLNSMRFAKTPR